MYADSVTPSMERAISETLRRREIQNAYNEQNGITPKTIIKGVSDIIQIGTKATSEKSYKKMSRPEREAEIKRLTHEMKQAAKMLEFELAATIRDKITRIRDGKEA